MDDLQPSELDFPINRLPEIKMKLDQTQNPVSIFVCLFAIEIWAKKSGLQKFLDYLTLSRDVRICFIYSKAKSRGLKLKFIGGPHSKEKMPAGRSL